jgi:hypothetical protein
MVHGKVNAISSLPMRCLKIGMMPEGQSAIEDLPEVMTRIKDLRDEGLVKEAIELANTNSILSGYVSEETLFCKCLQKAKQKSCPMIGDHVKNGCVRCWHTPVSLAPFPRWRIEKESKMYLTEMDPPNEATVDHFYKLCLSSLARKGPEKIVAFDYNSAMARGSHLYADGYEKKHDGEKPTTSWRGPFLYERYMTGPRTWREVWIPSKSYKTNSTYWMSITSQVARGYEEVVLDEDASELTSKVSRRMKPGRKMDLKGAGLQFPREYVLALLRAITETYGNDEMIDYYRCTESLFSDFCVKMPNGDHKYPRRGTGLGYYEVAKALVVAIILEDCNVIRMYNDDILIPEEHFETARKRMLEFYLIENEKKTGTRFYSLVLFGGYQIKAGKPRLVSGGYQREGFYGSIFTKRYHWERKAMCCCLNTAWTIGMSWAYEVIFGHEFFAGESMNNPENLGINRTEFPVYGWTRHLKLRELKTPQGNPEGFGDLFWGYTPNREAKVFNRIRKKAWLRSKDLDDRPYYWIRPRIQNLNTRKIEGTSTSRAISMWFEINEFILNRKTTGKMTCGLDAQEAMDALLKYKYSSDPYRTAATGGYEIIEPFWIERPAQSEKLVIAEALQTADFFTSDWLYKRGDYFDVLYTQSRQSVHDAANAVDQEQLEPAYEAGLEDEFVFNDEFIINEDDF